MTDLEAIQKAIEPKFTCQSAKHNAGLGLDNIRTSCSEEDSFWIISGNAALITKDNSERGYELDFTFHGTLLFYSISLSQFDDEEIVDFNW